MNAVLVTPWLLINNPQCHDSIFSICQARIVTKSSLNRYQCNVSVSVPVSVSVAVSDYHCLSLSFIFFLCLSLSFVVFLSLSFIVVHCLSSSFIVFHCLCWNQKMTNSLTQWVSDNVTYWAVLDSLKCTYITVLGFGCWQHKVK